MVNAFGSKTLLVSHWEATYQSKFEDLAHKDILESKMEYARECTEAK